MAICELHTAPRKSYPDQLRRIGGGEEERDVDGDVEEIIESY
jgi:hypothetical protein